MEVMRSAAEQEKMGREVLHLEVGQPSTPAPIGARTRAADAIQSEILGYTSALGLDALRERISSHYRDWYQAEVPASRLSLIHI